MGKKPDQDKIEELNEIAHVIRELSKEKDVLFIVEGLKDKKALLSWGIKEQSIYQISHRSYEEIVNQLRDCEIIDFIDEDKEGQHHTQELKKRGLFMTSTFKRKIFSILHIKRTEELSVYTYLLQHQLKDLR